jgi:hypothetical protein
MKRLSETHLLILVLLGFGVIHVISGVLIQRASTQQGNRPSIVAAWGD